MNGDEMGGAACGMQGRDEKCVQNSGQNTWKEDTTWETLHKSEDKIKENLKEIECEMNSFGGTKFPFLSSCEYCNLLDCINGSEVLDQLSNCKLLKHNSSSSIYIVGISYPHCNGVYYDIWLWVHITFDTAVFHLFRRILQFSLNCYVYTINMSLGY